MKAISHEDLMNEIMTKVYGSIGTPARDRHEIKHLFTRIAYNTKYRRKELGLSHEDLANRSDTDIKDITRIERGNVTMPIPKIHRVWRELGMTYQEDDNFYFYTPAWAKSKPTLKKKLTKHSTALRTIVR